MAVLAELLFFLLVFGIATFVYLNFDSNGRKNARKRRRSNKKLKTPKVEKQAEIIAPDPLQSTAIATARESTSLHNPRQPSSVYGATETIVAPVPIQDVTQQAVLINQTTSKPDDSRASALGYEISDENKLLVDHTLQHRNDLAPVPSPTPEPKEPIPDLTWSIPSPPEDDPPSSKTQKDTLGRKKAKVKKVKSNPQNQKDKRNQRIKQFYNGESDESSQAVSEFDQKKIHWKDLVMIDREFEEDELKKLRF